MCEFSVWNGCCFGCELNALKRGRRLWTSFKCTGRYGERAKRILLDCAKDKAEETMNGEQRLVVKNVFVVVPDNGMSKGAFARLGNSTEYSRAETALEVGCSTLQFCSESMFSNTMCRWEWVFDETSTMRYFIASQRSLYMGQQAFFFANSLGV